MYCAFEPARGYETTSKMPKHSTEGSAGADFFAAEDTVIPAKGMHLVHTGIKCKMPEGHVLLLYNRSSNPKKGLLLANGVGVIDSDYYGNEDNDGEIMFLFYNMFEQEYKVSAGDKIGQGIIMQYTRAINAEVGDSIRAGGFGSTG